MNPYFFQGIHDLGYTVYLLAFNLGKMNLLRRRVLCSHSNYFYDYEVNICD